MNDFDTPYQALSLLQFSLASVDYFRLKQNAFKRNLIWSLQSVCGLLASMDIWRIRSYSGLWTVSVFRSEGEGQREMSELIFLDLLRRHTLTTHDIIQPHNRTNELTMFYVMGYVSQSFQFHVKNPPIAEFIVSCTCQVLRAITTLTCSCTLNVCSHL